MGTPYDRTRPDSGVVPRARRPRPRGGFLLADGVYPGNEGRGYVLRRILRRAVRHAWLLGRREPTLAPLTDVVVESWARSIPSWSPRRPTSTKSPRTRSAAFSRPSRAGSGRLEEIFASGARTIPGDDAFKLYDTFGFPIDLTQIIAGERGVEVDLEGFERALDKQRKRSRDARASGGRPRPGGGRATSRASGARSSAASRSSSATQSPRPTPTCSPSGRRGPRVELVLRENPFYVESGGQVSDTGAWRGRRSLAVDSVRKDAKGTVVGGDFEDAFEPTRCRGGRRAAPARHRAQPQRHAPRARRAAEASRQHVRQQGSLVQPDRLRFDFSHHGPIDPGCSGSRPK